jgi:transcriptional regulator with XRE-family HTH domain
VRELTLQQLSSMSGISSSHLGRIEKGERFPSAPILRKIAKPLSLAEAELLTLAGYLSPQPSATVENETRLGGLDAYVAMVLSQEPVERQRAVITILTVLKSMARDVGFAEYVRRKYPELDEDTITRVQDIIEHPPKGTEVP